MWVKGRANQGNQDIRLHIPDIVASDSNLTGINIPKPGNQTRNCGFAGTGRPHQGGYGFSRNGEADIFKNLAFIIPERYILKFYVKGFRDRAGHRLGKGGVSSNCLILLIVTSVTRTISKLIVRALIGS